MAAEDINTPTSVTPFEFTSPAISGDIASIGEKPPIEAFVQPSVDGRLTQLHAEVLAHPTLVYGRSLGGKLLDVFVRSPWKDIKESEHPVKTTSLVGAVAITQTLDRLHLSTLGVPYAATHVLKNTHSAALTGLAAAGAFAAWNGLAVGETLTQGLDVLPNSVASAEENFPSAVSFFEDALPGFKQRTESDNTRQEVVRNRKIGGRILRAAKVHAKRALSGMGLGSTAYVGTGYTQSHKKSEARKHNVLVTGDTSILVFGVAAGAGEGIVELSKHGHPEAAMHLLNFVSDMRVWYGLAGVMMLSEFVSNRCAKKAIEAEVQLAKTQESQIQSNGVDLE